MAKRLELVLGPGDFEKHGFQAIWGATPSTPPAGMKPFFIVAAIFDHLNCQETMKIKAPRYQDKFQPLCHSRFV